MLTCQCNVYILHVSLHVGSSQLTAQSTLQHMWANYYRDNPVYCWVNVIWSDRSRFYNLKIAAWTLTQHLLHVCLFWKRDPSLSPWIHLTLHSPKQWSVAVDEVVSTCVPDSGEFSSEHGSQHGVWVALQRGQRRAVHTAAHVQSH